MRIVLSTFGTRGDVQPFVAFGLALRARGHDVVIGVPEDHLAFARASGLSVMPIHGSSEAIFATAEGRHWIERCSHRRRRCHRQWRAAFGHEPRLR